MLVKNWRVPSIEIYSKTSSAIPLAQEEIEESDAAKVRSAINNFQERDCVKIYLSQIGKISLLTRKEEIDLFQIIRNARNISWDAVEQERVSQARIRVVEGNLRLVAKIAMRYRNLGLPFLDLVQEGNVGLMKAVEKFDLEKGFRFTTYATWWIQQSMMRALTDHSRTIRLPAHIVERLGKLNRSRESLQQRNNKQPTIEEVAAEVSLPVDKVRQTLELSQDLASLDMPLDEEDDRNSFIDLVHNRSVPSPEDEVSAQAIKERLDEVLETLAPREAEVLKLRFGLSDGTPYTLEQLGRTLGITRERVRQIEKKALMKLRHPKRSLKLREFMD
ncbi:RNA polymerase sigma factor RpoD/SigA [Candidatus Poribacteria bacterium]